MHYCAETLFSYFERVKAEELRLSEGKLKLPSFTIAEAADGATAEGIVVLACMARVPLHHLLFHQQLGRRHGQRMGEPNRQWSDLDVRSVHSRRV